MTLFKTRNEYVTLKAFRYRYDHLKSVLTKVLNERPENVVDIFEDISKEEKKSKFTSDVDTVLDKLEINSEVALNQIQTKLFFVRFSTVNMLV